MPKFLCLGKNVRIMPFAKRIVGTDMRLLRGSKKIFPGDNIPPAKIYQFMSCLIKPKESSLQATVIQQNMRASHHRSSVPCQKHETNLPWRHQQGHRTAEDAGS